MDVGDAFQGAPLKAEVILTNATDQPLRGVRMAYAFDAEHLTPLNYTIESDHPAHDQSSWGLNDADAAPGNPPKDALGAGGEWIMHAFGAGESKRVVVDLRAGHYSLGAVEHADVRAWVKHIDGVYEDQGAWDMAPGLQRTEGLLQARARLDVLSRAEWQFDAGDRQNVEGWSACESVDKLWVNTEAGALAVHAGGAQTCVTSPPWTQIEAQDWDQLVLRTRSHDGDHVKRVSWKRDGEEFSMDRAVLVAAAGDSGFAPLVIPVGDHPEWRGQITGLRVHLDHADAPVMDGSNWHDLDALFLQSSSSMQTNSAREGYVEGPVSTLLPQGDQPDGPPETPDPDQPDDPTPTDGDDLLDPEDEGEDAVVVNSSCASAPGGTPGAPGWIIALAMAAAGFARRLRRR